VKRLRIATIWVNRDQRTFAVLVHHWKKIYERRRHSDAQNNSEIKGLQQALVLPIPVRDGATAA